MPEMLLPLKCSTKLGTGLKLQDLVSDFCGNISFLPGAHCPGATERFEPLVYAAYPGKYAVVGVTAVCIGTIPTGEAAAM